MIWSPVHASRSNAQRSDCSHPELELTFGLGGAFQVDEVTVTWADAEPQSVDVSGVNRIFELPNDSREHFKHHIVADYPEIETLRSRSDRRLSHINFQNALTFQDRIRIAKPIARS